VVFVRTTYLYCNSWILIGAHFAMG
jgi:hypothetical protein